MNKEYKIITATNNTKNGTGSVTISLDIKPAPDQIARHINGKGAVYYYKALMEHPEHTFITGVSLSADSKAITVKFKDYDNLVGIVIDLATYYEENLPLAITIGMAAVAKYNKKLGN